MARGITISILILLVLLLGAIFVSIYIKFALSKKKDTPQKLFKEIFNIIGEGKGQRFIDLGAGNFNLLIYSANLGFNSTGVEISPIYVLLGKIIRLFKRSKATIKQKNIFKTYLKEFDIIYINQQDSMLIHLKKKLTLEINEKSSVYLYDNKFPQLQPTHSYKLSDGSQLHHYKADQFK